MVLPRSAEESAEEEDDPRLELVRQLIEYKKFKDAAALLEAQAERQGLRLPRQPLALPIHRPVAPAVAAGGVVGPGQRLRPADARDVGAAAAADRRRSDAD